jgi:putative FmdB family regulatory protein
MPTYLFRCTACRSEAEYILKIDNRDEPIGTPCADCGEGHYERVMTAVPLCDPVRMGIVKPPTQMREVLQQIHARTPGSVLDQNTGLGRLK